MLASNNSITLRVFLRTVTTQKGLVFYDEEMMETNLVDWIPKSKESSSIKLPNSWLILWKMG